jgi:uncharacterized membrane protein
MSIEPAGEATSPRPAASPTLLSPSDRAAEGEVVMAQDPPDWLMIVLGAAYVMAVAGLLFMPGGTLIERLRALDAGICSQLPTHSFYPAGQQLPLCARNTGIYVGFSATLLVLLASSRLRAARLPGGWVALALVTAVVAMATDGFNSLFLDLHLPHLYQPHNLLRLATGLGTGTAMAAFLVPIANGLIWRAEDARPTFASFRQLAIVLPMLVLAFLLIASQDAWLLYPLALLGTAGLVTALSLINLVFVLGVSGRVARFATVRQVFPLFTLAVALAIVELVALSALKTAALQALSA